MKKVELLAPVGSMEALVAAISAGCDAVYLGGYTFGARAFATNFSNEELANAVLYAHLYGVKVYVTVNTIVYESEVSMFTHFVSFLVSINVDALIIQDLGMVDLIGKMFPDLELHASTQMHIHNLEGVKFLEKTNVKRVVLARETDIDLIREIRKNTDMELEVFVHGALCVSYSGQCLMSSLIGNRSGNRGSCSGSCRQKYSLVSGDKKVCDKYLLSMKDLNTLTSLDLLIESGVDSLKIEGRMKSKEYVYLVVKLYRMAIDTYYETGKVVVCEELLNDLKKVFNREFTKGFLFKETSVTNDFRPNHLGVFLGNVIKCQKGKVFLKLEDDIRNGDGIRIIGKNDYGCNISYIEKDNVKVNYAVKGDVVALRVKENVDLNSKVVKTQDNFVIAKVNDILKKEPRKVFIEGLLKVLDYMTLTISDGVNTVVVKGENRVLASINNPTSKDTVIRNLKKTGNTVFEFSKLDVEMPDDVFIPLKEINNLRRLGLTLLTEKRCYATSKKQGFYDIHVLPFLRKHEKTILIRNMNQYEKIKKMPFDAIYIDDINVYNKIDDARKVFKLPRVNERKQDISGCILIGDIGCIREDVITDFSFNVVNSYTVAFLHSLGVKKVTLSHELSLKQIKELIENYEKRYQKHPNLEFIIYGREEAMITKFDLLKKYGFKNEAFLKDRFNNLYPVIKKDNLTYIFNYKKLNMDANLLYEIGVNSVRYNVLTDDEIDDVLKSFKNL